MKLQIVIIDEPIHIDNNEACKLWQRALWLKEKGYRRHYKTSIMPIGVDDFFATHYIVAEEKSDGQLEPMAMLKSVRRSQSEKFNIPFGAESLLKNVDVENTKQLQQILLSTDDISYVSSFTINPHCGIKHSALLRNYITAFICHYFRSVGISRWVAAGVTKYKIDKYIEWLGGKEIVPEFSLPIIDNQTVRMMYIENAYHPSKEALIIADSLKSEWENRIVFEPNKEKGDVYVLRAA